MVPLHVLVIDDDPRACTHLRQLLTHAAPEARVLAELHSFAAAEKRLGQYDYDLVFLDVQLPVGDGFDLVPFVRPEAAIIFVTARDDHVVRAIEVNAVDYLLKPVGLARRAVALERGARRVKERERSPQPVGATNRIFLRGAAAGGRFVSVIEIVAILSSENYTEVILADGEKWLVRRTMAAWQRSLPSEIFVRVHRTALVNLRRVERVERNGSEAASLNLQRMRHPVPVGRRHWPQLNRRHHVRRPRLGSGDRRQRLPHPDPRARRHGRSRRRRCPGLRLVPPAAEVV